MMAPSAAAVSICHCFPPLDGPFLSYLLLLSKRRLHRAICMLRVRPTRCRVFRSTLRKELLICPVTSCSRKTARYASFGVWGGLQGSSWFFR